MKKLSFLLVIVIVILAFFLRFYQLSNNPPGLYLDEASIGYNAFSILKTSRDEYGQFLPLSFKAFGEYKLPVYIYSDVFSLTLFGINEFAVRFPSALAGVLTVILIYYLTFELFNDRRSAVLSSFLLAITPWHLQFSRAAFEANLSLFFLVLASLFFLKGLKRPFLLLPSSLMFSLTFLTYPTYRLFTPLFILILLVYFRRKLFSQKLHRRFTLSFLLLLSIIYSLVFLSPYFLTRFTVVSAFHGHQLLEWPEVFFRNYLSYFSFDFLFFQGDQIPRHNPPKIGNLYFFEIPLAVIGFYQLVKNSSQKARVVIFSWLFLAPSAAALTLPSPHSLRSLTMVIPLVIISALGFSRLISWLETQPKIKSLRGISYSFVIFIIIYFLLLYLHQYYIHYPKTSGLAWQEGNKEMAQEVIKREKGYDRIFISDFLGQPYLYLLFYGQISPDLYRSSLTVDGFGKYHFVHRPWPSPSQGKTLWVLSFDDKFTPEEGQLLKEIKIANGDLIYRLWETE